MPTAQAHLQAKPDTTWWGRCRASTGGGEKSCPDPLEVTILASSSSRRQPPAEGTAPATCHCLRCSQPGCRSSSHKRHQSFLGVEENSLGFWFWFVLPPTEECVENNSASENFLKRTLPSMPLSPCDPCG